MPFVTVRNMQRRIAIAAAAAVALVLTAGGVAVAAGIGVLGSPGGDADPVGQLSVAGIADLVPTSSTAPQIVVVDEWVTVPGAASSSVSVAPGASAPGGSIVTPPAQSAAPEPGVAVAGSNAVPVDQVPVEVPTPTTSVNRYEDDDQYDEDEDDDDDDDEDDDYEDEDDD